MIKIRIPVGIDYWDNDNDGNKGARINDLMPYDIMVKYRELYFSAWMN